MEIESNHFQEAPAGFPFSACMDLHGGDETGGCDMAAPVDYGSDAGDLGDKAAELVDVAERCRAKMIWLATRITNRREEAEDIVQQALIKAFMNLSKFRGDAKMRTWLTSIVQNTAREYARSSRARTFVSIESNPFREGKHEELDLTDPAMNPEERYERWERVEVLYAAIRRMSASNQHLLQLCVFEEMPYDHVASRLGTRVSAIKSRVFRSKHLLRSVALGG
jgi:RNA polymerase sigma-70 factor (ECF subfamily)